MHTTEKTFRQERYQVVHQFESSGKNAFYEAYDSNLKANVVLKEFAGQANFVAPAQQQEKRAAFVQKAKVLTGIHHEFLPRVYDYFSEADRDYLVTELIDGNDLKTLLEIRKEPFALIEAAGWAEQLLEALSSLHRNVPPVIHGDVKPQNIRLTGQDRIKLTALENAEVYNSRQNTPSFVPLSDTSAIPYLPIEQIWPGLDPASQKVILHSYDERSEKILEQPIDPRSDIYALGATVYHLLTGQAPADALARSIELMEGNADPLRPPAEVNPSIPAEISDVLMRALEIRRENRFDSAVIMRQVLRTALVRTKEIEAAKIRQKDEFAAAQLKLAEQKRLEQERRAVEQKRLELEAGQKKLEEERRLIQRQALALEAENKQRAEIIERQLRQAEAQKMQARQPTDDEEKTSEQQNRQSEAPVLSVTAEFANAEKNRIAESTDEAQPLETALSGKIGQKTIPAEITHNTEEISGASNKQPEEFSGLFAAAPAPNNRIMKRMAAAAGAMIVLGGISFGIWFAATPKTAASGPPTAVPVMSLTETAKPAPTVETAPEANFQTVSETLPETAKPPEISETRTASPAAKNKIVPANPAEPVAARVQKPVAPAAKPAAEPPAPKKSVTVDDIISDN